MARRASENGHIIRRFHADAFLTAWQVSKHSRLRIVIAYFDKAQSAITASR
jgi:hypothetical protein